MSEGDVKWQTCVPCPGHEKDHIVAIALICYYNGPSDHVRSFPNNQKQHCLPIGQQYLGVDIKPQHNQGCASDKVFLQVTLGRWSGHSLFHIGAAHARLLWIQNLH